MGGNKNTNFLEKHQNRPSVTRLAGVPPPQLSTKTPKTYNKLCFNRRKLKRELRTFSKNVKIQLQDYVLHGSPLPVLSKKTPKA